MYNFKLISLFLFTLYIPTFQVWECWFCDNLHNVFIHYRGAAYDIHEGTYALYCTHCTVLYCTVRTVLYALYCTVRTVLYALYCTVLYALHCTVLYSAVLPLLSFSLDCLVLIIFYIVFTLYWILYYVVCCYTLYVICCVVLIMWDCKVYIRLHNHLIFMLLSYNNSHFLWLTQFCLVLFYVIY
jgi:hypothetical protein